MNKLDPKMTFREVLVAINRWAAGASSDEKRKLWDVFSALRGPDEENEVMKEHTTCVIRRDALLNLAIGYVPVANSKDKLDKTLLPPFPNHFRWHIIAAASALGLLSEGTK